MIRFKSTLDNETATPAEIGTSYFGIRDPDHARRDLDRFADAGLNGILHTFSERDRKYYADTMERIVRASRERNITVYVNPWGVGRVFGGEALSEFTARKPEACQLLSNGERAPAACPNAPAFRRYMDRWIEHAAALDPDVLFWDEPHWYTPRWRPDGSDPEVWTCRCPHCRKRFSNRYDRELPSSPDEDLYRHRENSLLEFLQELMRSAADRGLRNAVCIMPGNGTDTGVSNWSRLARSDDLDVLATTPYWALHGEAPEPFVRTWTDRITGLADDRDLLSQIWIQGFLLDGNSDTLENLRTAIRTAVEGEPDSLFLWGWDGCRVISSIACENPMEVWETYLTALQSS